MSPTNLAAKPAPTALTATSTSKAAPASLAKSATSSSVKDPDRIPVPPAPGGAQRPTPALAAKLLIGVFSPAGGVGKSANTDTVAALYREAKRRVLVFRMESSVRREEFAHDEFIDLDQFADAESTVGGVSAFFDPAWARIEQIFTEGGIALLDGGANSHGKFITLCAETGLPQLVVERGGRMILMVVITRDAELIKQAVDLIAELRGCAPEAEIVVVLNERDGAFVDDSTPEGRAYRERLRPLLRPGTYVTMPLARARSMAAFASCGRSITEIKEATDDELMRWSGQRLLAARSCQARLSAFYVDFTKQLKQVLPFLAGA